MALIEAVASGLVDIVVSAHCPAPAEDKRRPFDEAAPGSVGLETLLAGLLFFLGSGPIKGFGVTLGHGLLPAGIPLAAVLADSHAALYAHGCTLPGTGKATYGTGSSVMAPVANGPADGVGAIISASPTVRPAAGGRPACRRHGRAGRA